MIHPDTELGFVNPIVGQGVFATRLIPAGTITWVRDDLDHTLSPAQFDGAPRFLREIVDHYAHVNARGHHVFCWDLARYINHSCDASSFSPDEHLELEIAVRDIAPGEMITNDYGTQGLDRPFSCGCGARACRREIRPDDAVTHGGRWNALATDAFHRIPYVTQPLWELVRAKSQIVSALGGRMPVPSRLGEAGKLPLHIGRITDPKRRA